MSTATVSPAQAAPAKKSKAALLKNPWLLVVFMIAGVFIGNTWPQIGKQLALPGELFLAMLTMSVIPVITTAIIGGLARMLRSGMAGLYMKELLILFVITVLIGSGVGLIAGFVGQPGLNLGSASETFLGNALLSEQSNSDQGNTTMWEIILRMVPANVFSAFSNGEVLSIIFASVMIGWAVGVSKSAASGRFLELIEGVQEVFVRILGWVLYALPFGLLCMMAGQLATLGIDALLALSKFIMVFYVASLVMCLLYIIVIWIATGLPLMRILSAIRDPLFVSFSAASCVAPIPIAIQKMEQELEQPPEVCNLVIPLSVAINRHSYALLFSLTAVFVAQVLGKQLEFSDMLLLFFMSALVGTAAAGRLAAVGIMLVYVFAPLGIPVGVGATIYIAIGAILDPMVQMCILFGGCANAAVIGKIGRNRQQAEAASSA